MRPKAVLKGWRLALKKLVLTRFVLPLAIAEVAALEAAKLAVWVLVAAKEVPGSSQDGQHQGQSRPEGEEGHSTSNIQHPTSNIQHPTSNLEP